MNAETVLALWGVGGLVFFAICVMLYAMEGGGPSVLARWAARCALLSPVWPLLVVVGVVLLIRGLWRAAWAKE